MATITDGEPGEKLLAKSKISSKGQITLPIEVRNCLGVKEGESVKFVADKDGRTVVLPVRTEENSFEKWIGTAPPMTAPAMRTASPGCATCATMDTVRRTYCRRHRMQA